ncbi:putative hydrolase [Aspergillus heteromorphus CBS 117.55]|uniref:Putative hydrolase n=1 Tax=Aspergillus heteromorphus CBS 117.55 TaxID=1448321 RepID=A0A317W1J7_9EURO|nr:putative hydrolase [Aspergillus heteromorphus CBS 117.55]PWY79142.1 putative hydrolase [Aspergillus heteromorphus CBS 117.55]
MSNALTQIKRVPLPESKTNVFYREQGAATAPVILLLHGFPSSSHQYRNLIPLLAVKYRVIAPDLPGFGFTEAPLSFEYTFANLTSTVAEFLDVLGISQFSVYIFDYGAPTGLRLALQRPEAVQAIITQNGNAYEEGLGIFWDPVKLFWASRNEPSDRDPLKQAMLTYEATKWQYDEGTRDPTALAPEAYHLDYALLQRPGNPDIQIDLFKDYENNVKLYPEFHEYFRKSQVPLLAIWGKNDPIFIPPGAEAFKRDLPDAEVHLIDAGHFAVESDTEFIGQTILKFLERRGI